MKALSLIAAALVAILLSGAGVALAQGPFEAKVAIVPDQLVIGDVVWVTATVDHPADYVVGPVELDATWGPFEVRGLEVPVTATNADGSETTRITFETQIFETGQLVTPEMSLTVISPSGAETTTTAAAVTIDVASILQDGDLRDIRPQAELPGPRTALVVGSVLAGLAALVIAILAYVYLMRVRSPSAGVVDPDPPPPYEWAISELVRIDSLGLTKKKRFKEHYVLTSEVVRRYMDGEFGLDAVESTTAEVSRQIRESAVQWRLSHRVLTCLFVSDLVKFARYRPTAEEVDALVPDAASLIHDLHRELAKTAPVDAAYVDTGLDAT